MPPANIRFDILYTAIVLSRDELSHHFRHLFITTLQYTCEISFFLLPPVLFRFCASRVFAAMLLYTLMFLFLPLHATTPAGSAPFHADFFLAPRRDMPPRRGATMPPLLLAIAVSSSPYAFSAAMFRGFWLPLRRPPDGRLFTICPHLRAAADARRRG